MQVNGKAYITGLLTVILFLPGCWKSSSEKEQGVKVINVLDKQFYDDAHIPGSVNISIMDVENRAKSWKKDTEIVVYCSNYKCTASGMIAKKLKNMGFTKVYAYEAGMAGWKQAGLPVDGPATQKYLTQTNEKFSDRKHADVEEISTQELKALLDKDK